MRRRDFIKVIAGSTAGWPLIAYAQQPVTPVIGFLHSGLPVAISPNVVMFRNGLAEMGYVEGRNATIEYRWAEGQYDRLPKLASELVRKQVSVIVAGSTPAAVSVAPATSTIPIVFTGVSGDPVKLGLVKSFNRPGGNITGIYTLTSALEPKKLEVLHELLPTTTAVGFLSNPGNPNAEVQIREMRIAARSLGLQLALSNASSESELDASFAALKARAAALIVGADPFFTSQRDRLVALAARHLLPAIYEYREFPAIGGLVSYGTSLTGAYRQAGVYAGQILKGTKAGDLPVVQPTKFELVINLKTAKALGLTVPPTLLARADEVIE